MGLLCSRAGGDAIFWVSHGGRRIERHTVPQPRIIQEQIARLSLVLFIPHANKWILNFLMIVDEENKTPRRSTAKTLGHYPNYSLLCKLVDKWMSAVV